MTEPSGFSRNLAIFAIAVPLAIAVGFFLASPITYTSLAVLGLVLICLLIPGALNWHHPLLVGSWSAALTLSFLPGQPKLWMLVAVVSLGISMLNKFMDRQRRFLQAPALTWLVLAFGAVVFVTAYRTGGLGFGALGSSVYGGKKYAEMFIAIIGFFALIAYPIPPEKVRKYTAWFFLAGASLAISNIVYLLGSSFWWLYWIFPVEFALGQAYSDFSLSADPVYRLNGFSLACLGPYLFMLGRFGVRGVLDFGKPWRLMVLLGLVAVSLLGGFRSILGLMALTFRIQFLVEGLHKTRLLPALAILGVICFVALIPVSEKLPLSMQRSLSFLPLLELDPLARHSATASTEWRLQMWNLMIPDLPNYLVWGKGFSIDPTDMYLATQAVLHGLIRDIELVLIVGDYHSGPLSLYVAFGLPGTLLFIALIAVGTRMLYLNFKNGDPSLRVLNGCLLAYFIARIIFFVVVFGAINSDLYHFLGTLALSMCVNRGVQRATVPAREVSLTSLPALQPA